MRKGKSTRAKRRERVIPVADLAPREAVTGGSAKILFGQRVQGAVEGEP